MQRNLLDLVVSGHGGLEQWNSVRSIDVTFNYYGALLDLKGYPGRLQPTASIDTQKPRAIFRNLDASGDRWVFTPERVWIEGPSGRIIEERVNPRAAFAGHVRATPWDRLHLLYFMGYTLWNYMTTPFVFTWPGFRVRELDDHRESLETWRVMEVKYPDGVPAHSSIQKFYFDSAGNLKRLDYVLEILGGVGAHYCYDPKTFDGIVIPTLRRVVRRTPDGPLLSGPSSFILDYTDVRIHRGP